MDLCALFSIARIGIIFTAEQWLIRWATPTLPAFYGLVTSVTLTVAFFINYAIALFVYDRDMLNGRYRSTKGDNKRLPPQRPEAIPLLGNATSFLWNPREFLQSAGSVITLSTLRPVQRVLTRSQNPLRQVCLDKSLFPRILPSGSLPRHFNCGKPGTAEQPLSPGVCICACRHPYLRHVPTGLCQESRSRGERFQRHPG